MRNASAIAALLLCFTFSALAQNAANSAPPKPAPSTAPATTPPPQPSAASTPNNPPAAPANTPAASTTPAPKDAPSSANPADQALEKQIADQLANKPEFQYVKISVQNGIVFLDGNVPTKIERNQAKSLVRGVNGVKKVKDRLILSGNGVTGPGIPVKTRATAQNNAVGITGNADSASANAAPTASPATGGTTGTALTANAAPPSSTAGAGTAPTTPSSTQRVSSRPAATSQPAAPPFTLTAEDPHTLAARITAALKRDPSLANDNVSVNVTDQGIEVIGNVNTGKEKVTAMRIAQSYATNAKVFDRITLAGHAPSANQNAQQTTPPQARNNTSPTVGNQVLPSNSAVNSTRDQKNSDKSTPR
jgi:osmotically-inducible protein OsmY